MCTDKLDQGIGKWQDVKLGKLQLADVNHASLQYLF